MASLAETRDKETGGHILRTQHYVLALARRLSRDPLYRGELTEDKVDMLFKVAPLHDVGKVGVRDSVLLKPGHLTGEEFEEMKKHTTYASETLLAAENHLGGNAFLAMAREIAESHQEKWDGSGYPRGLEGEEIPLSGRIMAVADVYDALVSRRTYKDAVSHREATAILVEGRGTHFDPAIIEAFIDIQGQFQDIARRYADNAISEG
jgi:putative two-component system response regulator